MIQWNNTANNNQPAAQPQMPVYAGECNCPACRMQRLINWLLVIALVMTIISLYKKLA